MKRYALPLLVLLGLAVRPTSAEGVKEHTFAGHPFRVDQAALSPDGKILASGGGDTRGGALKLWDVATGKELASLPGYTGSLYGLAFSPDGRLLASAGDAATQVWDVQAHRQRTAFRGYLSGYPPSLVFSPDARQLALAAGRTVQRWDLAGGTEQLAFILKVDAPAAAFSRDLQTLASSNYQEIDLWDVPTGKLRRILSEHRGEVGGLAFGADDKVLVAASAWSVPRHITQWQGQVKLWDPATGRELADLPGPFGYVRRLAPSPDGRWLAFVDWKDLEGPMELKLLNLGTGRHHHLLLLRARRYILPSLRFAPGGRLLVAGGSGQASKLWEFALPKEEGGAAPVSGPHSAGSSGPLRDAPRDGKIGR